MMCSAATYFHAAIKIGESISPNIKHFTNEFDIDDVNNDAHSVS